MVVLTFIIHSKQFFLLFIEISFVAPEVHFDTIQTAIESHLAQVNTLPPSDAVREQKNIFLRIFLVQYCQNLRNITPLEI